MSDPVNLRSTDRAIRPETLTVLVAVVDDTVAISLHGELDLAGAPQVRAAFDDALGDPQASIFVDLGELGFIDSSGLRELIRLHQRGVSRGKSIAISPGGPGVRRVIELSGLAEVLPFVD